MTREWFVFETILMFAAKLKDLGINPRLVRLHPAAEAPRRASTVVRIPSELLNDPPKDEQLDTLRALLLPAGYVLAEAVHESGHTRLLQPQEPKTGNWMRAESEEVGVSMLCREVCSAGDDLDLQFEVLSA